MAACRRKKDWKRLPAGSEEYPKSQRTKKPDPRNFTFLLRWNTLIKQGILTDVTHIQPVPPWISGAAQASWGREHFQGQTHSECISEKDIMQKHHGHHNCFSCWYFSMWFCENFHFYWFFVTLNTKNQPFHKNFGLQKRNSLTKYIDNLYFGCFFTNSHWIEVFSWHR